MTMTNTAIVAPFASSGQNSRPIMRAAKMGAQGCDAKTAATL
jgi:hypothetical protein